MVNKNNEVAGEIVGWFENYASVYEFDTRIQFEDFSLEDMKSCDLETVWSIVGPMVKELVESYLQAQIEELEIELED
jgi:hypothetical protein